MKALVKKYSKSGLWMEDVPMPAIGDNDLLIKVRKTAICGTDVHIWKWDAWSQKTIRPRTDRGTRVRGRDRRDGPRGAGLQGR